MESPFLRLSELCSVGLYTEIPGQQSSIFVTASYSLVPTHCLCLLLPSCQNLTLIWDTNVPILNNYIFLLLLLKSNILRSVISKCKSLVTRMGTLLKAGKVLYIPFLLFLPSLPFLLPGIEMWCPKTKLSFWDHEDVCQTPKWMVSGVFIPDFWWLLHHPGLFKIGLSIM